MTEILLILLFPYLAQKYLAKLPLLSSLGPVALCYGIGILLANLPGTSVNTQLAQKLSHASLLIGLPLLLFTTDIQSWLKQAKKSLASFTVAVLSGVGTAITAAFLFADKLDEPATTAAMITGVYTGGTPNMNAIGIMLNAPTELFALLNAADIFWGGLLFLFLISIAPKYYGYFLPKTPPSQNPLQTQTPIPLQETFSPKDLAQGLLLSSAVAGISIAVVYLVFQTLDKPAWIFLLLTILSLLASFSPAVQRIKGKYLAGEYAILAFCVAIGLLADLQTLQTKGSAVFQFTGLVLIGTTLLHLLIVSFMRIDRDTALITLTAALYGPAFIPQVATALHNRNLILPGILTGLVGYALGNFVGGMVFYILNAL